MKNKIEDLVKKQNQALALAIGMNNGVVPQKSSLTDKILQVVKESLLEKMPKEARETGQLHPDINIQAEGFNIALSEIKNIIEEL